MFRSEKKENRASNEQKVQRQRLGAILKKKKKKDTLKRNNKSFTPLDRKFSRHEQKQRRTLHTFKLHNVSRKMFFLSRRKWGNQDGWWWLQKKGGRHFKHPSNPRLPNYHRYVIQPSRSSQPSAGPLYVTFKTVTSQDLGEETKHYTFLFSFFFCEELGSNNEDKDSP